MKQTVIPKVAFTGRRPPLHLDPPEHTPYRRALAPLLTERRVARLDPVVRTMSRDLIAAMIARGGGDVVADFSAHMPIATFAHWHVSLRRRPGRHRLRRIGPADRAG